MSILAGSLSPSYPSGVPPGGLQERQDSMSIPALFPEAGRQQRQPQARLRRDLQARVEKNQPAAAAARHDEAPVSDIPMDSSFDTFSGLVDFELLEQSMQPPDDDDNTSRNSQAPVDLDANALLSSYQQLFDATATTAAASSAFAPVF
jgi:hypothetical protein